MTQAPGSLRARTALALRLLPAVLAALCLTVLSAPGEARAEDPVALSKQGQITDRTGALGDRGAQVAAALDRLYEDRRVQLFVVYVRSFSGRPGQSWADATAARNGLGRADVLLAVATGDRTYAYSAESGGPLTQARLDEVASAAIVPALRQNDWAGAAIGAADGFRAVLAGKPVPAPAITPGEADPGGSAGGGSSGAGDLVVPLVAVGGAGAVATYAYSRRRKKGADGSPGGTRGRPAAAGEPLEPLPELDRRARTALVETDDAVRTSEEELGFATAQFGEAAAKPFTDALAYAKGELTAAFRLRQQLDDAFPEDDATRRRMLDEILTRCAGAHGRLDSESDAFDRLRALERNAPRAVAAAEAAFRELTGRVAAADSTLAAMRERYADSAAAPVADDVEQATDRLVFATTGLGSARQALDEGDNGRAAVYVRAVEGAVDQAGTLVAAVERRARELADAADRLPGALTETETDLADARGLLTGTAPDAPTADLRGRIARAESVLADVRGELAAGRHDPIDALRRVEEADAALDEALAGAREREQGQRRARDLLDQALLAARSSVGAAADYIATHRGAVGSEARTRLAEAQRRLERAGSSGAPESGDAREALADARTADALARQAQELAENEVRGFGNPNGSGGVLQPGGGLNGAVLGGIILGGLLNGGGRGGGHGQGRGGGGGPGSFGGGGTRGRLGGGGRF
ncbi:TPM domain-containing protein [Streptomyces sp. NPDC050504]|uniref:TPM domain-containing protein n=1 Tax=Streptomyces sp. NPDC050504 TaxID=3365618 RepID=UPI0037953BE7